MAFATPSQFISDITSLQDKDKIGDIDKDKKEVITLTDSIIKLFHEFYHNSSYAGELKIRLLDHISIGGNISLLQLVMKKEPGNFDSVNNSYYKFYIEFSSNVPGSRHPVVKKVDFIHFNEQYEPAFNEEALKDLLDNCIDTKMISIFAKEFFNCDLEIIIETKCNPNGETYTLKVNDDSAFKLSDKFEFRNFDKASNII